MEVSPGSLKLSAFWASRPEPWFCHEESQFAIRKIVTDDAKYRYVVASLDSNTANRALSLVSAPPGSGKYDALKAFLLSAFKLTLWTRRASRVAHA